MKPIFSRGPSLQIRLILAVLVALGIIIADSRLGTFSQIRTYMDTAVSPFYFVSNAPRELLDGVSQTLASRDQLELENRALRQELLLKNSELLMLGQYKQENARLRELLGSPLRQDEQKMVTQVISTVNDPYSDQVVIDKGSVNGVYEGQPVISDKGVVGQVVAVAKLTSRVLLICDATHALPPDDDHLRGLHVPSQTARGEEAHVQGRHDRANPQRSKTRHRVQGFRGAVDRAVPRYG